jgi:hypothetical protein
MLFRHSWLWALTLLVAWAVSGPAAAQAASQTWDAAADFTILANPNGDWSYGWSQTRGSAFSLLPTIDNQNGVQLRTGSGIAGAPLVLFNPSDATISPAGTNPIPAHSLGFHPGPGGQNAIVRWTAPANGAYRVAAIFTGRDTVGPTSTDVSVLLDGSRELWSATVNGYLATQRFDQTLTVTAGETIQFDVGYGNNGSYFFDSTGLDATITAADTTPPSTSATFSTQSGPYTPESWTNQDVTVTLAAAGDPAGSVVAATSIGVDNAGCTPVAPSSCNIYSGPVTIGADGMHDVTYFSTDAAGNVEQAHSAIVAIDKTPPTVTCSAPVADNWYSTNVAVQCRASDLGSGLADASDGTFALTTAVAAGQQDGTASTGTRSVCDAAGNCVNAGPYAFQIDEQPPTITCGNTPTFLLGQSGASVSGVVTDAGSGATTTNASAVGVTSAVGTFTVQLTAADQAANTAAVACPYKVQYRFSGFLAPIRVPTIVNAGHAGRAYPIKWQLTDALGNPISVLAAIKSVLVLQTSCSAFSNDPTDALTATTTGSSGLHYDSGAGQFIFNWATTTAGCYTLFVGLADGRNLPVYFTLS